MGKSMRKTVMFGAIALATFALVLVMKAGFFGERDRNNLPAATVAAEESAQPVASDATAVEDSKQDASNDEVGVSEPKDDADVAPKDDANEAPTDDSYEARRDQLLDELADHQAPVGDNARDAAQEQGILTVAELSKQLADRGFPPLEITANFDLAGTFLDGAVLDSDSEERYPSYQMIYRSNQGVAWVIAVNAQAYFAVPVAAEGVSLQRQIILSESNTVIQYDGIRGQYSDFGFDELGDALGIQVAKIDRATLESYTAQQLGAM